jgi:hypothetical protein
MNRPAHRSTSPTAHLDESYVFSDQTLELMLKTYVRAWDLCFYTSELMLRTCILMFVLDIYVYDDIYDVYMW